MSEEQSQQQFSIQKIYLKDTSFETPHSPTIFQEEWKPEVGIDLGNSGQHLVDDLYEVVITLTVTAKVGDKPAFLVEVQQAGIFAIKGFNEDELGQMLGSYCPNILFPYAREVISDIVTRGGFPQLLLSPVNFEALYAQHQQEQQEQAH